MKSKDLVAEAEKAEGANSTVLSTPRSPNFIRRIAWVPGKGHWH